MSFPKGPDVQSKVQQGQYTEGWRFLAEDTTLAPNQYSRLVQKYGKGLLTWDMWMLLGRHFDVSTRNLQVLSEGSFLSTVDVAIQTTPVTANNNLTFVSAKNTLRENFTVHIPSQYSGTLVSQSYLCLSKTYSATSGPGSTPAYTYVCTPIVSGQTVAAMPVGQKLVIGAPMFAAGTRQPSGMTNDFYQSFFTSRILKEANYFEGGQIALKEWDVLKQASNGSDLRARAAIEAELRLRLHMNDAFLLGLKISTPAGIQQANRSGENNNVLSADGLIPTMVSEAMKLPYTGEFGMEQFDLLKFLFASQGVNSGVSTMLCGPTLRLGIENMGADWVKEYSGGSDLYDKLKGVGFGISEVFKNGFKTYLIDVPEFINPQLYGADGYNFDSMGLIFPDSKVTATLTSVDDRGTSMGSAIKSVYNCEMGYLNNGGENRRLITGNKAGVNGLGLPFSDDWDDSATYTLTEILPVFTAMNQTILVTDTAS